MKEETLEALTDNRAMQRYYNMRLMAQIVVHNTTYRLNPADARDRAWASLCMWYKWGLWGWSQSTIRAMGGVVNTIAELVLYYQENKQ